MGKRELAAGRHYSSSAEGSPFGRIYRLPPGWGGTPRQSPPPWQVCGALGAPSWWLLGRAPRSCGCSGPATAPPAALTRGEKGTERGCKGGAGAVRSPPALPVPSLEASLPAACRTLSPRPQLPCAHRRLGSRPNCRLRRSPPSSESGLDLCRGSWEGGSNCPLLPGRVWGPRTESEEPPSGASAAGGVLMQGKGRGSSGQGGGRVEVCAWERLEGVWRECVRGWYGLWGRGAEACPSQVP